MAFFPLVLNLFLALAMGHFLGDFGLQSDRMAAEKCPGKAVALGWRWWLISHAAIHGFIVTMVTGLPILGLAELCVHALIDLAKCRKMWSLRMDQLLHLGVKLLWAILAGASGHSPGWLL